MKQSIPDGYHPWQPSSPFMVYVAEIGELYQRNDGNVLALRVQEEHTNRHHIAHGGMLATIADCALGHFIALEVQAAAITVQMSIDYLNAVKPGDWLEAHVLIDKKGRSLAYATCLLKVGDKVMLKASTVFAIRAAAKPVSDG